MAEFSWAAAADVGLGLAGGVSKFAAQLGADKAARANAEAQNVVRTAKNDVKRSELSLAATIRSINNKRIMEHGAQVLEAAHTNAIRTTDSFTRGNFEQSIKDAEQLGHAQAAVAASGLGGSSIQGISAQVSMAQDRRREIVTEQQGQQTYDQLRAMAGVMPAAISQMDFSPLVAGFDRNVNTSNDKASLFGSLVDGLLSKKDSLHTLLGSFGGSDKTNSTPASGGATSYPVSQSSVTGEPLASFSFGAESFPVSQSTVRGSALAPISIN